MAILIKTINDNILIEFDKGSFDAWCVYLTVKNKRRYAPLDIEYFGELLKKAAIYSPERIYNDFLKIYSRTDKTINPDVLLLIDDIAVGYQEHAEEINIWLTVIYAGMIAEENKEHAILKKRIKRLGMYQIFVENQSPEYAANFSKGKKWRDLDLIMKQYGF